MGVKNSISPNRGDQGEAVGLKNGCDGAVRAEKLLEVVKRSRFDAGKMTERTYEKTCFFWQNMEKKYKCAHKSAPQLHKRRFFEKT